MISTLYPICFLSRSGIREEDRYNEDRSQYLAQCSSIRYEMKENAKGMRMLLNSQDIEKAGI